MTWYEVHRLGRRYRIPQVDTFPKVPITNHGWFRVGQFDEDAPAEDLRDFGAEQWNRYRHPRRVSAYAQTTAGERVVYFEQSDHLEVDAERACEFVTCSFDYEWYARVQAHAGIESARFWQLIAGFGPFTSGG